MLHQNQLPKPKIKSKCTAARARSIVAYMEAAQNEDRAYSRLLRGPSKDSMRKSEKSEKPTDTPHLQNQSRRTGHLSKIKDNRQRNNAHAHR